MLLIYIYEENKEKFSGNHRYIILLKIDEFGPVTYSRGGQFLMFTLSLNESYVILNVHTAYDGQV